MSGLRVGPSRAKGGCRLNRLSVPDCAPYGDAGLCAPLRSSVTGTLPWRHSAVWTEILFQNWSGLIRTIIVGALAYAALIATLRTSGKRTLSKMNAFDLV